MAHSVTVQPALAVRAALSPSPTDLQRLLLRLDLENQQVRTCTTACKDTRGHACILNTVPGWALSRAYDACCNPCGSKWLSHANMTLWRGPPTSKAAFRVCRAPPPSPWRELRPAAPAGASQPCQPRPIGRRCRQQPAPQSLQQTQLRAVGQMRQLQSSRPLRDQRSGSSCIRRARSPPNGSSTARGGRRTGGRQPRGTTLLARGLRWSISIAWRCHGETRTSHKVGVLLIIGLAHASHR